MNQLAYILIDVGKQISNGRYSRKTQSVKTILGARSGCSWREGGILRSVSEMKYYQLPKWWHLPNRRWNCSCMCSCTYARLYIISIRLCEVKYYQLPKWLHLVIELRAYSNAEENKKQTTWHIVKSWFRGLDAEIAIDRIKAIFYVRLCCETSCNHKHMYAHQY